MLLGQPTLSNISKKTIKEVKSLGWTKSKLCYGSEVKIQSSLLVSGYVENFIKAVYEGETKHGIMLRFFFESGFASEEPTWDYAYFVSWPSIYCGHVKLMDMHGNYITAKREVCA